VSATPAKTAAESNETTATAKPEDVTKADTKAKTDTDAPVTSGSATTPAPAPAATSVAPAANPAPPATVAATPPVSAAPQPEPLGTAPATPSVEAAAPALQAPLAPTAATPAPTAPAAVLPVAPKTADATAPASPALPEAAAPAPALAPSSETVPGTAQVPGELPATAAAEPAPATADLPPAPPTEAKETLLTPAPEAAKDTSPAKIVLDAAPDAPAPLTPLPETEIPAEKDLPKVLDTSTPATLAPNAGLKPGVAGISDNTLPQIGAAPAADAAAAPAADTRPIIAFARSFTNDTDKPAFAIVLRDTGAVDVDREKLAALPFPISFVIDPAAPNAKEAAAIYRAAGQEVVMLATGIPQGATAADLEQTFQANAAVLPEAVAVMDVGEGGFQDNRPLASLVVPVIGAQGRGVLTFDQGLNAADQVARRNGVPAAVIFRDLDADGEDATKIRRYLDRAAFKAAQEGRVVVVGSTRPDTIAALMEWTVEGRATSVILAPLTAVLQVN
jgi:uncharacterized protein